MTRLIHDIVHLERDHEENAPLLILCNELKVSASKSINNYLVDILYKSTIYKFSLSVDQNISWIMIANYAFSKHLSILSPAQYLKEKSLTVHSLAPERNKYNRLDLQQPIRFSSLSSYLFPTTFRLEMEGPINLFEKKILANIIQLYLLNSKQLNTLMKVSKEFNKLFSSDVLWTALNFTSFTPWLGYGSQGTDDQIWRKYQHQKGLPSVNCVR